MVVRGHREKLGDVRVEEGEAVGRWLGVVSRAVVGAVRWSRGVGGVEEEDEDERMGGVGNGEGKDVDVGDWNVVQNNGRFALVAQSCARRGLQGKCDG